MLRDWISEARPRTLLLASTNCATGCGLGFYYGAFNLYTLAVAALIVLTAVLLQVLTNMANDYGDGCRGADSANRLGPVRPAMTGAVSMVRLRRGMGVVTILACLVGLLAVYLSVHESLIALSWFIFLGTVSIIAALFYTLGIAYGYHGFGDIAVFIFFGLLAVGGSQSLITNASGTDLDIYPDTVMLAISVGADSVMVLNVANMRDIAEDRLNGKRTIPARLGYRGAAIYHVILFIVTVLASFCACFMSHKGWEFTIIGIALLPLLASTYRAANHVRDGAQVAPELKYTVLGCTFHHLAWMVVLVVDFWFYF
ncbi:MAG: 1,4-dihydroxy-2-naphthoate octaprenyltransferase [Succinivibrionaceae bacterium]|nr:1,4-dihydroxy-2-naphthoate octaprenyltransferase [Succinivibrionaceae bacterium]